MRKTLLIVKHVYGFACPGAIDAQKFSTNFPRRLLLNARETGVRIVYQLGAFLVTLRPKLSAQPHQIGIINEEGLCTQNRVWNVEIASPVRRALSNFCPKCQEKLTTFGVVLRLRQLPFGNNSAVVEFHRALSDN
jgi:hypothetical protein